MREVQIARPADRPSGLPFRRPTAPQVGVGLRALGDVSRRSQL